jgi:hypothetical protein
MRNSHGVDLDLVVGNAAADGIDLAQISLFYSGLTDAEELELRKRNLVVGKTEVVVIGRFNSEGVALFAEKISSVYYLGA